MDTLPAVRAALKKLYVLKSIDILINSQRVIGKSFYRTPIFKHIVVCNISFSVGNTTGVFNFPYPSRCHPFPYFPFPSLLTGNTTTVFDFSLPFPCNPFPTLPYTSLLCSSFPYPSCYHKLPLLPLPSILTGSTTIVFEFPYPSPAIPSLLLPTLVRGRSQIT